MKVYYGNDEFLQRWENWRCKSMKTRVMIYSVEETLKDKERLITFHIFMEPNI